MITTTILGVISILFAYLARYSNAKWGLKVSFILIFLFLALRYDFGNDYQAYLEFFHRLSSQKYLTQIDFIQFEPFWVLLNFSFKNLGFFSMTIFIAAFTSITYYKLIKKYVPEKLYWLAVFFYIFNPLFMLIGCSAMRQSIAITLFLISLEFVIKRKLFLYLLCIGAASLFHYTAVLLTPVYFLNYFIQKISLKKGVLIFLFYLSLFPLLLLDGSLSAFIRDFVWDFAERFEYYYVRGDVATGLGFVVFSLLLIMVLFFERKQAREIGLFFKISIMGFLIMPLSLTLDIIGRFALYFAPSTIIVYPNLLKSLNDNKIKVAFLAIIMAITIFQYIQFFYSEIYHDFFMNYQTIFSADGWQ